MSWFDLDPTSVVSRLRAANVPANAPTLGSSLLQGMFGFALVSVAGFAPWALFGRAIHRRAGELGLYALCALIFIGASGLILHTLIIGPGSLSRFYRLFGVAFSAYSIGWIAGWMALRGHSGSLAGLLLGAILMGWILAGAFEARSSTIQIVLAIFILNAAGYFLGGWIESSLTSMHELSILGHTVAKPAQLLAAKLQWGVCYGMGLGAGLGFAFYVCQMPVRALLSSPESPG